MMLFYFAFLVCLVSNFFHTLLHYAEYKGKQLWSHKVNSVIVNIGWAAWSFMLFTDPSKINLEYKIVIGGIIGVIGIVLVALAHRKVPFEDPGHLL